MTYQNQVARNHHTSYPYIYSRPRLRFPEYPHKGPSKKVATAKLHCSSQNLKRQVTVK